MNLSPAITEKKVELDLDFVKLADQLSNLINSHGIPCKPYQRNLPFFSLLPNEKKIAVISNIKFYYELCLEQVAEGYSLKDNPSFIWRAFRHFGYTPTSDLFAQIENHHIIEIYTDEGIQVFRNLKYFEYCSYTLEELYTLEWYNLYERSLEMQSMAFESISKIFKGEQLTNFNPEMPKHIVKELQSSERLVMEYGLDLMGPLFQNKKPKAAIVLETARLLTN